MTTIYKAEAKGKVIVRKSENREFSYAVIMMQHPIKSGYATFHSTLESAAKAKVKYLKMYGPEEFLIVETTTITELEYATIKAGN